MSKIIKIGTTKPRALMLMKHLTSTPTHLQWKDAHTVTIAVVVVFLATQPEEVFRATEKPRPRATK